MNFLITRASQNLFRMAYVLEDWVGIPHKVSESLYFRRAWRKYLNSGIAYAEPALWIHGASVGELENLANFFLNSDFLAESGYRADQVVLTASSVSAKEFLEKMGKHNFRYAGPVPPEDRDECRAFLSLLNVELLVMSHTDIWPCLLEEAKNFLKKGCVWLPKALPKGHLLEKQFLFPIVRAIGLNRSSAPSLGVLKNFHIGNPRLDRVYQRIQSAEQSGNAHPLLDKGGTPKEGRFNVIIGSCWSEDALVWAQAYEKLSPEQREKIFLVAIPHDIGDTHEVAKIQSILPWARVLPVSGVLLEAYRDFDLAFVGGGYKSGLHSIVEPALWGVPVACGPLTRAQVETERLVKQGSLAVLADGEALHEHLRRLLQDVELRRSKEVAARSKAQLLQDLGATRRLVDLVKQIKTGL